MALYLRRILPALERVPLQVHRPSEAFVQQPPNRAPILRLARSQVQSDEEFCRIGH